MASAFRDIGCAQDIFEHEDYQPLEISYLITIENKEVNKIPTLI